MAIRKKKVVASEDANVVNPCEVCVGKGRVSDKESCSVCEGTGVKK